MTLRMAGSAEVRPVHAGEIHPWGTRLLRRRSRLHAEQVDDIDRPDDIGRRIRNRVAAEQQS